MKLYRYEINCLGDTMVPANYIDLKEYDVIGETPKGYYINKYSFVHKKTWVSKTGKKRFAYPTKEEAMNYFMHRCMTIIRVMKWRIAEWKIVLSLAKDNKIGYEHHRFDYNYEKAGDDGSQS